MFELASPWVLFFLLLPCCIWYFFSRITQQLPSALQIPFFMQLSAYMNQANSVKKKSVILFFLVWFLLIFAASGPRWVGPQQPLVSEGYNIMLILDISGSMSLPGDVIGDQPISRLDVVKKAALQFVQGRQGDRLGLILFGTRAYLQTPLTFDLHNVMQRIDDATVGLAGENTAIGDALGLGIKRLEKASSKGRIIILLTDGATNTGMLSPLKAAKLAMLDKIKIYTIGFSAENIKMTDWFGNQLNASDLDEDTLEHIAEITQGQYFRATDSDSLKMIYNKINALERSQSEQLNVRPQHDYYPWPLIGALLILFSWFIKQMTGYKVRFRFKNRFN